MTINKKFINIFLISILSFLFQGCFEVIHFMQKNSDGTISVFWNFSISSALASDDSMPGVKQDKKESIQDRLKASESESQKKLKDIVQDLDIKTYTNEYEVGFSIKFNLKELGVLSKNLKFDEGFPLLPRYDSEKKILVFNFLPDKEKQKKIKQIKSKKKKSHPIKLQRPMKAMKQKQRSLQTIQ